LDNISSSIVATHDNLSRRCRDNSSTGRFVIGLSESFLPPSFVSPMDHPIQELHQMVAEAKDCEAALLAEINLLEKALKNESHGSSRNSVSRSGC
jgi:hypothetical protein